MCVYSCVCLPVSVCLHMCTWCVTKWLRMLYIICLVCLSKLCNYVLVLILWLHAFHMPVYDVTTPLLLCPNILQAYKYTFPQAVIMVTYMVHFGSSAWSYATSLSCLICILLSLLYTWDLILASTGDHEHLEGWAMGDKVDEGVQWMITLVVVPVSILCALLP